MLKGDAAAIGAIYREDAVEMPSCQPPVYGRTAIERYYHDFFTNLGAVTSFTLSHLEADAVGDVAFIAGTSRMTIAVPSKGAFDDSGKYVVVLKRTNGAWKVAYAMSGGDHQLLPPPQPPATAQH
jgi:ketosteroid isomerase-like protein